MSLQPVDRNNAAIGLKDLSGELLLRLFAHVAADQYSLFACTYLSRRYRPYAQDIALQRLFCALPKKNYHDLITLFSTTDSQSLRYVVRRITLKGPQSHVQWYSSNIPTLDYGSLRLITQTFPKLRALDIIGLQWCAHVPTSTPPHRFHGQRRFVEQLTDVQIMGIHITHSAETSLLLCLASFPNLSSLRIGLCSVGLLSVRSLSRAQEAGAPLRRLCLELDSELCSDMGHPSITLLPPYNALQELQVWDIWPLQIPRLSHVLEHSGASLTALSLGILYHNISTFPIQCKTNASYSPTV